MRTFRPSLLFCDRCFRDEILALIFVSSVRQKFRTVEARSVSARTCASQKPVLLHLVQQGWHHSVWRPVRRSRTLDCCDESSSASRSQQSVQAYIGKHKHTTHMHVCTCVGLQATTAISSRLATGQRGETSTRQRTRAALLSARGLSSRDSRRASRECRPGACGKSWFLLRCVYMHVACIDSQKCVVGVWVSVVLRVVMVVGSVPCVSCMPFISPALHS